jgi:hypothetical protein
MKIAPSAKRNRRFEGGVFWLARASPHQAGKRRSNIPTGLWSRASLIYGEMDCVMTQSSFYFLGLYPIRSKLKLELIFRDM